MAPKTALFIVAEGSEELELVAPVDILRRANVTVTIADITDSLYVKTKSNLLIKTDAKLGDVQNNKFDAVVIPGGPSHKVIASVAICAGLVGTVPILSMKYGIRVEYLQTVTEFGLTDGRPAWIRLAPENITTFLFDRYLVLADIVGKILLEHEKSGKVIAAICAAPFVLFKHGIAKGKSLTSYPTVKNDIESFYQYKEDSTVVDGNLVTSRGPATAVEFGLTLVEVLLGNEEKVKVAKGILYPL